MTIKVIKKSVVILFGVIIVVVGVGWYFNNMDRSGLKDVDILVQDEMIDLPQIDEEVVFLKELYGATPSWDYGFSYTLEAQRSWGSGSPIIFKGQVEDVYERDGQIIVSYTSSFLSSPSFKLELVCPDSVVERVLMNEFNDEISYLLGDKVMLAVVTLDTLSRPIFSVQAETNSEYNSEIELDDASVLLGEGKCMDIVEVSTSEYTDY